MGGRGVLSDILCIKKCFLLLQMLPVFDKLQGFKGLRVRRIRWVLSITDIKEVWGSRESERGMNAWKLNLISSVDTVAAAAARHSTEPR